MSELSASDGSEGYEACDDAGCTSCANSSPRDNLLLLRTFKNPETAMVSGFSFCRYFPIWCKLGATILNSNLS